MDYKEKYEQGLECLEEILNSGQEKIKMTLLKERLQPFFPELKESEDERIRKAIISVFTGKSSFTSKEEANKYIAWLEKQGEQKPTDNVEPKFKEGDWIVDNCNDVWQVVEVSNNFYRLKNINEFESLPKIKWVDETFHLWSVKDAKDGDVLAGSKNDVILMFRGIGNTEWDDVIDYHCYYDCYRKDFIVQEDVKYWGNIENNQLKPATKEQRDLLFSKMQEAGYEWDAEKKELKLLISNGGDFESNNSKQKPTWSDEDEEILKNLIDYFSLDDGLRLPTEETIDWLKSLKERLS